jgi:prophage antirepressor-like protein
VLSEGGAGGRGLS